MILPNQKSKAPLNPKTSAKKSKARPLLPPDAVCKTCGQELAVFWQSRGWCIHCEADQLFGVEIAAHRERVAKITREVGK